MKSTPNRLWAEVNNHAVHIQRSIDVDDILTDEPYYGQEGNGGADMFFSNPNVFLEVAPDTFKGGFECTEDDWEAVLQLAITNALRYYNLLAYAAPGHGQYHLGSPGAPNYQSQLRSRIGTALQTLDQEQDELKRKLDQQDEGQIAKRQN
jgi:hypothetical protein